MANHFKINKHYKGVKIPETFLYHPAVYDLLTSFIDLGIIDHFRWRLSPVNSGDISCVSKCKIGSKDYYLNITCINSEYCLYFFTAENIMEGDSMTKCNDEIMAMGGELSKLIIWNLELFK